MTAKEIRGQARKRLKGNWLKFAMTTIVSALIVVLIENLGVNQNSEIVRIVIGTLIIFMLGLGIQNLYLGFTRESKFDLKNIICSPKQYLNYLGYKLVVGIVTFLLCIILLSVIFFMFGLGIISLFSAVYNGSSDILQMGLNTILIFVFIICVVSIVIGILIQLYLGCVPYLILDDNGVFASIGKSIRIIKGHKFRLFKLILSFIGWHILSLLTLGFGYIFLLSYLNESITIFYLDLIGEYK